MPKSVEYGAFYEHVKDEKFSETFLQETPYFLVVLVAARHLDYSDPHSFFKTLAKHPSDGSKNGDVGHAWIYLQGIYQGELVSLEGGHSGELGQHQPRYMEGVFLRYEEGDVNPISYLWESQKDGFFQIGSGRHAPTFAAKIDLTEAQFLRILKFIECYDFSDYAITGNQCCSFAAQVAAFAGLYLDCEISMQVDANMRLGGREICLWSDSAFSEITFSSPDILEKSLMQAVIEERAEYALSWYYKTHPRPSVYTLDNLLKFPERYLRFKLL